VDRWIVLLRGVNVGGGNKLPMAELRASLADAGFTDIVTHIQSGNVVLDDPHGDPEPAVADRVRRVLSDRHDLAVPVVVRPAADLEAIAAAHPDADGPIEPRFLHVLFLDRAPSPVDVEGLDPSRWAPDRWTVDGRDVHVTYPNGSGRSKLTIDVFERAWAVTATGRNLNTVRQLARLAERA
jgi:uncharacterized protein (DUF1697 family)